MRGPGSKDRPSDHQRTETDDGNEKGRGAPTLQPSDLILDGYEVERLLGRGGMGSVYLVRSRSTGERFAVKRCLQSDQASDVQRRAFLRELLTWSELPEHPHLTSFRFLRTRGEDLLIFSEYVAGGSLKDRMDGEHRWSVPEALDLAVQTARGLHQAHLLGVVHQDVKPANVLLATDGTAKLTDFGLARARSLRSSHFSPEESPALPTDQDSLLVTSGGFTPAFASPEQLEGRPVNRRTDVWSWGLTTLVLLAGEVHWISGLAAPELLEIYLEEGTNLGPEARAILRQVLKRCFLHDPLDRWSDLTIPARELERLYACCTGKAYPRPAPIPKPPTLAEREYERVTAGGARWQDPRDWLERALRACGQDPARAEEILFPPRPSRRSQAIADLAAFDEARRLLDRLLARGRIEQVETLARLCSQMALPHEVVGDLPGARGCYDRAIRLMEPAAEESLEGEEAMFLAHLHLSKANAIGELRSYQGTVPLFDRALQILEQAAGTEDPLPIRQQIAQTLTGKAIALGHLGQEHSQKALDTHDRAIEAYRNLQMDGSSAGPRIYMASSLLSKAVIHAQRDESTLAFDHYDRAASIFQDLIEHQGRRDLLYPLAMIHSNRASLLNSLERPAEALPLLEEAIRIYRELLDEHDQQEVAPILAAALLNRAISLSMLGDPAEGLQQFDETLELLHRLLHEEGNETVEPMLARAIQNRAYALGDLGHIDQAVHELDRAIARFDRLIHEQGREDLKQIHESCRESRKRYRAMAAGEDLSP